MEGVGPGAQTDPTVFEVYASSFWGSRQKEHTSCSPFARNDSGSVAREVL
jgi:hypothetical protein